MAPKMNSNDRFAAILQRIQETHDKKQKDYGTDEDPFANITAAKELDIEPWVACVLRMNDKMMRLKAFIKKGGLANESVEDSLLDLATYAAIALTMYDEGKTNYSHIKCEQCGCPTALHGSTYLSEPGGIELSDCGGCTQLACELSG